MMDTVDPIIPGELVAEILQHLGTQNTKDASREALIACLHVSRSFRHHVRPYLFSTVNLIGGVPNKVIQRIALLLEILNPISSLCGPGIGPFVKNFQLRIWQDHREHRITTVVRDPNLPLLLQSLHRQDYGIESLTLKIEPHADATYRWGRLPKILQREFFRVFQSPRLSTLRISFFTDFPSAALRGTHLKHVNFRWVYGTRGENTTPGVLPQLQTLATDNLISMDVFLNKTSPATPSSLKQLTVFMHTENYFDKVEEMVKRGGPSLEGLRLGFDLHHIQAFPEHFNRSLIHSLWSFQAQYTLDLSYNPYEATPSTAILHMTSMLHPETPRTNLQTIRCVLHIAGRKEFFDRSTFDTCPTEPWVAFDGLLCNAPFKSNTTVIVTIKLTVSSPLTYEVEAWMSSFEAAPLHAQIAERLPGLHSSNRLEVVVHEPSSEFPVDSEFITDQTVVLNL